MDKRKYIIINDLTGEIKETTNNLIFIDTLEREIKEQTQKTYFSPLDNEQTIYIKPIKVIKEYYTEEENDTIKEKATITTYKEIYNPYSEY